MHERCIMVGSCVHILAHLCSHRITPSVPASRWPTGAPSVTNSPLEESMAALQWLRQAVDRMESNLATAFTPTSRSLKMALASYASACIDLLVSVVQSFTMGGWSGHIDHPTSVLKNFVYKSHVRMRLRHARHWLRQQHLSNIVHANAATLMQ